MRVGIISLLQESNTFLPERTRIEHFKNDILTIGQEVKKIFSGTHHEVAGFLSCLERASIEAVPIFAARAVPYGIISGDAWKEMMSLMFGELKKAGPLDGVLVAPHGATVSEPESDADGFWLSKLRAVVGPTVPIIGTLDPHANLSRQMVQSTNALVAYRTNPHIDQFDSGVKAASLMIRTLRGEIRPKQCTVFPPVAINIERQETAVSPCQEFYSLANRQLQSAGVLANSILLGFAYADVPEMGSATLVVTDDTPSDAERLANELAEYLWQHREEFAAEAISIDEALQRALRLKGHVCLLDTGDNIGGGSPGDSTWLAHELYHRRVDQSLMCIVDPCMLQNATRRVLVKPYD